MSLTDLGSRESIGSLGKGDTVIHVIDDIRQIRKDFSCKQSRLLEHMKYFEACLAGVSPDDEVEISVHCDIKVFEWLAEYMDGSREVSTLDTKDVVSILISADFLQMRALVEECIERMYGSLEHILALPLDLGCLPERLVLSLAAHFDLSTLEKLEDKHDRLKSRLYAHKLQEILSMEEHVFFCCSRCRRIFTAEERKLQICPQAPASGEAPSMSSVPTLLQHSIDSTWDVGEYVHQLREIHSWSQLFWKIWGRLQHFQCKICKVTFTGLELHQCRYHPEPAVRLPESDSALHPCCDVVEGGSGCQVRSHQPFCESSVDEVALDCILRHQDDFGHDDHLLFAPAASSSESNESKGAAGATWKTEEDLEVTLPELRARYCCEPAPEHSATAPSSQVRPLKRRPQSAPRTPRAEVNSSALEYRLQRSPFSDASDFQNLLREDLTETSSSRGPSFFEPKLPKGVSSQRKLHHMMDVLREDDRRRMDELTTKIYACRAKSALAKAQLAAPNSAASQAHKLSWMVQGWSSEDALKFENRRSCPGSGRNDVTVTWEAAGCCREELMAG